MSVKWMREQVDEAGLPQPDKIYWDRYKTGGRYKLVWDSEFGGQSAGSRLAGGCRRFEVPPVVQEDLEPLAQEFEEKLGRTLPDAEVQGYVAHGFMYGWNTVVTVHVGGAHRSVPTYEELFHRRYGYTQG